MLLQTIIVYTFLTLFMYLWCQYAAFKRKWGYVILAILAYAIVFGVRYGVGVDSLAYMEIYEGGENELERLEPGFKLISTTLHSLGVHYSIYFGILAFIQLYLLFMLVKDYPVIYPFLVISFMLGAYWLTFSNGLRQITAFCIFAFSIPFTAKKQYFKCLICLALAISMHKSAWLLLPIYMLLCLKDSWFNNIKIQVLLFCITFTLSTLSIIKILLSYFDVVIFMLGYDYYLDSRYIDKMNAEISFGLGAIINLAVVLILILYSNKIKNYFSISWLPRIYDLFYIGIVCSYLFQGSQLFGRINYYFIYFQIIFMAFALYYFYKQKKHLFVMFLMLLFLIFSAVIYRAENNTAMYYTFWQQNEYKEPVHR